MDAFQAYLESQLSTNTHQQELLLAFGDAHDQHQPYQSTKGSGARQVDEPVEAFDPPPEIVDEPYGHQPSHQPQSRRTSICRSSDLENESRSEQSVAGSISEEEEHDLDTDGDSPRITESDNDENLESGEEEGGYNSFGVNQSKGDYREPYPRAVLDDLLPADPVSFTISDDQSIAEKIEERHLLALRILLPEKQSDSASIIYTLQKYQLQSMLLEQQNKKRLMMARAEHAAWQRPEVGNAGDAGMTLQESRTSNKRAREIDQDIDIHFLDGDIDKLEREQLEDYIQKLQKKVRHMNGQPAAEQHLRYVTLYRILRVVVSPAKHGESTEKTVVSPSYFDRPEWFIGEGTSGAYRCSVPVENLDLYLEKNKDIAFIVYQTYLEPSSEKSSSDKRTKDVKPWTPTVKESIRPVQAALAKALTKVLEERDEYADVLQTFHSNSEVAAPYIFCYHHRSDFDNLCASADSMTKAQLTLLLDHVIQTYGEVYRAAEAMISQGRICHEYMEYLFNPGETVVQREKEGDYTGWVVTSWPKRIWMEVVTRQQAEDSIRGNSSGYLNSIGRNQKLRNDKVLLQTWSVTAWHWQFNVTFYRNTDVLKFFLIEELEYDNVNGANEAVVKQTTTSMPIRELKLVPERFCSIEVLDTLRRRGQTFWKCRDARFVSYREMGNDLLAADERYMIDLKTYKSLHKDYNLSSNQRDDLGEHAMKQDQCPEQHFELLLPLTIKGFNLRRKKWYDLMVDRISDVVWRKEAFTKIVMDAKAKEIVRALISKQLASERSTDLIAGKGNGLILLLHGGPGTGKTLTAESVAEIAEKPLYRVTCGDVGTKAEAVEKYLESVFHLGKKWGCVVLVDEADVFLEQRDLQDLDRNALVSVFLRVLEYYEGILVLTSNRVGTFDEAFRSRIQLALHYPSLNQQQRYRIWENFIDRLETFNDEGQVNISDLRCHLEGLSREEMNGREIRNAITTARQYAEYMQTTLTYVHLKDVIEISGRFDKYLGDLRGGFSQDELKKDEGIR